MGRDLAAAGQAACRPVQAMRVAALEFSGRPSKTPAATIYAAIIREIAKRGESAEPDETVSGRAQNKDTDDERETA